MDERRRAPRYPVATVVEIALQGHQTTTTVSVQNISTKEMKCSVNHPFQKGDILLVQIKLTTPNGEVVEDSLTGEAMWIKKVKRKRNIS